jgi:glycerophosphoryl diester phosphodiesterase
MPSSLLSLDTAVVIAHRGGSRLRPENTMIAFEHAMALGVDAIECDVHLSKDGQLVVIHDATVDRTTNAVGPVAGFTADALAGLDAAWGFTDLDDGRHRYRGMGVGVPRLTDVLARCPSIPFVIEIKGDDPAVVPTLVALLKQHGREDSVIVGGFSQRVLGALRRQAPAIVTSASRNEVQAALYRSWCWLPPKATGCRLFQIPFRFRGRQILTRRLTRAVRRGSLPVHAWIVDDPADIRQLLAWGVTGIITDRPDLAREVVAPRA